MILRQLVSFFVFLMQLCPAFRPSSAIETKVFCARMQCVGTSLLTDRKGLISTAKILATEAAFGFREVHIAKPDLPKGLINCQKMLAGARLISESPICCNVYNWNEKCGNYPPGKNSVYNCVLQSPPCTADNATDTTTTTNAASTTATTTSSSSSTITSARKHIPGAAGAGTITMSTATATPPQHGGGQGTTPTTDQPPPTNHQSVPFEFTISIAVIGAVTLSIGLSVCCCCWSRRRRQAQRPTVQMQNLRAFENPSYRLEDLPPALPSSILSELERSSSSSSSGNSDLLFNRQNDGSSHYAGKTKSGVVQRKTK